MNKVAVYLLTGFLGSGKTTLLKCLLAHTWEGKSALVVNEFGSIGLDGEEIQQGNLYDLVEIRSGCVCCMLQGQFVESFCHLMTTVEPMRIFVEASGVADPSQVLNALQFPEIQDRLGPVAVFTVVDATFFPNREFLGTFYDKQIRQADVVLLNKIDCVAPGELDEIETSLEFLNPSAAHFRTTHCNIDPDVLLRSVPAAGASRSKTGVTDDGEMEAKPVFRTFSIELPTELCLPRLEAFLERRGRKILRMKGAAPTPAGPVTVNFSAHGLDVIPTDRSVEGVRLVFVVGEGVDEEAMREELLQILSG